MPQMLFPIFAPGLSLINPQVGFEKRGGKVYYFNGQFCFHVHEEEDVKSFRFVSSQMVISGLVRQVEVVAAFGVTPISVKRSVKLLRERGAEGFFEKPATRSAHVLTPQVVQQVQERLGRGLTAAQAGRELGLKADTIRKGIARGLLSRSKKK